MHDDFDLRLRWFCQCGSMMVSFEALLHLGCSICHFLFMFHNKFFSVAQFSRKNFFPYFYHLQVSGELSHWPLTLTIQWLGWMLILVKVWPKLFVALDVICEPIQIHLYFSCFGNGLTNTGDDFDLRPGWFGQCGSITGLIQSSFTPWMQHLSLLTHVHDLFLLD